jgi:hypothetical protein
MHAEQVVPLSDSFVKCILNWLVFPFLEKPQNEHIPVVSREHESNFVYRSHFDLKDKWRNLKREAERRDCISQHRIYQPQPCGDK